MKKHPPQKTSLEPEKLPQKEKEKHRHKPSILWFKMLVFEGILSSEVRLWLKTLSKPITAGKFSLWHQIRDDSDNFLKGRHDVMSIWNSNGKSIGWLKKMR